MDAQEVNRNARELIEHRFIVESNSLQHLIAGENAAKGFNEHATNPLYVPTKLALVTTEIAEAIEAHRCGDEPDPHLPQHSNLQVEMADAVIRLFHLAGDLNFSLAQVLVDKLEFNRSRPHKHGGKKY